MEKISKRVNTWENFRKKFNNLKINIHQLKYALPIAAVLLATSCNNKEKHTPQYEQAQKELEQAQEMLENAEDNMENAKDYEKAIKDFEEAKKNLEEATKKMEELGKTLPTTPDDNISDGGQ